MTHHINSDPDVHQARSLLMRDDKEDLQAHADRIAEPEITYQALLKDLKKHGKL